jgi:hypothetical protein
MVFLPTLLTGDDHGSAPLFDFIQADMIFEACDALILFLATDFSPPIRRGKCCLNNLRRLKATVFAGDSTLRIPESQKDCRE